MASESDRASDSDDVTVTEVSGRHQDYMKSRLLHYISETKEFSARIRHIHGQPAQIEFTVGDQTGRQAPTQIQSSNAIIVRDLPSSYDEQHLQMFFEFEKGQGGGPVKKVVLNREERSAVIEFESKTSVDKVLRKCPIKIMETPVDIGVHVPYLEKNEQLGSVHLNGLQTKLRGDLEKLQLQEATTTRSDPAIMIRCDMPDKMKQFAITCLRQRLLTGGDFIAKAHDIMTTFEQKYNGSWNCILGLSFNISARPSPDTFISFIIGEVKCVIFKSPN